MIDATSPAAYEWPRIAPCRLYEASDTGLADQEIPAEGQE